MSLRALLPLLTLSILSTLPACGGGGDGDTHACTAMGCSSGAFVTTKGWSGLIQDDDPEIPVVVCLSQTCAQTKVSRKGGALSCANMPASSFPYITCLSSDADSLEILLQVKDDDPVVSGSGADLSVTIQRPNSALTQTKTAPVSTTQPNGPSCEPTCRQSHATFAF